jgi:hypothetical protein
MKYIITERQLILIREQSIGIQPKQLSEQKKPTPSIPPLKFGQPRLPASSTYVNNNIAGRADFAKERANCMKSYNTTTLSQAVNWWKDWLKSPTTLNKFAKNWKISTNEASEIFKKYNDSLSDLKFEYYSQPSSRTIASVRPNKIMGYSPYEGIIYVNCANNDEEPLGILIHEIQHILYEVKPFHPLQKIDSDLKINRNNKESIWTSLFGSQPELRKSELSKAEKDKWYKYASNLKSQGIRKPVDLINSYLNVLRKGKQEYIYDETEILSRLYGIRKTIGVKPGQDVTVKDFVKIVNDGDVNAFWIMMSIMNSGQTIQDVLNRFNTYADTNTNRDQPTKYNV